MRIDPRTLPSTRVWTSGSEELRIATDNPYRCGVYWDTPEGDPRVPAVCWFPGASEACAFADKLLEELGRGLGNER